MAMTPIRRLLLERLRQPGSAASLAEQLDMPRQKLGYHLRALEDAGMLTLVEQRPRRGFTERILMARADAFVIDPAIMGGAEEASETKQDRFAAEHLMRVAAGVVRDVTRMRSAAEAEEKRLLTFTVEAEVVFAAPDDIEQFTTRLAEALSGLIKEFEPDAGGRRYRIVAGGHPAAGDEAEQAVN